MKPQRGRWNAGTSARIARPLCAVTMRMRNSTPVRAKVNNAAVILPGMMPHLSRAALIVLCATILVSVMSASMTTVALPDLQRDFDVGADTLTWVVTAYLITFATGTVVYGRLADMVGTKRMYVVGLSLFVVASFGVAIAPSFWLVAAMRAVQGFGGTAVPSLSMATIVRTTSPELRGKAMGATILAVGVGFALGPLAGGALTEWAGWRAPFFVTAGCAALLLPLALRVVPGVPGTAGQRFDFTGALMLALAVTGDILALNRLPRDITDPVGLAGAALSIPLWALLVLRIRTAPEPFISPEIAGNRRFAALAGVGLTTQAVHFSTIVLIPLLLANEHGVSIIRIGVHLLPGALAIAVFGMTGGVLLNRLGARPLVITGAAIQVAGVLVFHLAGFAAGPWGLSGLYVVIAIGYALVNASVIAAATAELPEKFAGLGVGMFNLAFFLGGAVSVALAGAILRSREGAGSALNPFAASGPTNYSDAFIVVLVFSLFGLALALTTRPRQA